MKRIFYLLVFCCGLSLISHNVHSQTNPTAENLPFSLYSLTGSTLPNGIAVHRFGTTAAAIPTTRTTANGTGDMPYNATANSGSWRSEGDNGISLLASGSYSWSDCNRDCNKWIANY